MLQRFRGELVLLGGRDEADAGGGPADDDTGDWGRTPSQSPRARRRRAGGGARRSPQPENFDDLDDEIPF